LKLGEGKILLQTNSIVCDKYSNNSKYNNNRVYGNYVPEYVRYNSRAYNNIQHK
jgi:hypothetical protein